MAKLNINSLLGESKITDLINSGASGGGGSKVYDVVIGMQGNGYTADDVDIFLDSSGDIYGAFMTIKTEHSNQTHLRIFIRNGNYSLSSSLSLSDEWLIEGESRYCTIINISQAGNYAIGFENAYSVVFKNLSIQNSNISSEFTIFSGTGNHIVLDSLNISSSADNSSVSLFDLSQGISELTIMNSSIDMGSVGTIFTTISYPTNVKIDNCILSGRQTSSGPIVSGGSAGKLLITNSEINGRVNGGSSTSIIMMNNRVEAVYSMSNCKIINNIISTNCNINDTSDTYCVNNIIETGEIWNNTDNAAQSSAPFENATVTMNVGPDITNILVEKG